MERNRLNNIKIIQDLCEKTDIVSIIGKYVKLKKRGNDFLGICPFHPDKNPSLSVSPKRKYWKCFVCGEGGNVVRFIEKYFKCSQIEAIKKISEEINYDLTKYQSLFTNTELDQKVKFMFDINSFLLSLYEQFLFDKKNILELEYLKKRGLDEQTIKYFHLGFAPNNTSLIKQILTNENEMFGNQYNKNLIWNNEQLLKTGVINDDLSVFLVNRIIFPIFNIDDKPIGFSGRTMQNILPKYSNSKENQIFNKSKILYNLNNVVKMQNIDSLYIVEGFMDTIAFYRIGVLNVVATMGVNLSPFHIKTIISLESIKKIILCFDNDNAGKLATFTNGISLLKNGFEVYVVNNFKDSKDIDELLNKKNINDAKIAVEDISDFITYFINLKINEKKVEKNVIEEIIKVMIETNDILLKNNHLQLISEKTNIPFEDIKSFFNNIAKNDDDFLNYDVNEIDDSNNKHNDKDNSKINDDNLKNIESINNKKLNLFEIGCKKILADFLFNAINFPELIQIFFNKIGFFMPQKYFPEYYNIFKLLLSYTNNAKKPYSLEDFLNYVEEKNGQEYASEIKIFINSNPRMNLKNEYLESGIKNIALLEKKMNEYKISELLEKIKKENDQNKTKDYFEQIKKIKEENKK